MAPLMTARKRSSGWGLETLPSSPHESRDEGEGPCSEAPDADSAALYGVVSPTSASRGRAVLRGCRSTTVSDAGLGGELQRDLQRGSLCGCAAPLRRGHLKHERVAGCRGTGRLAAGVCEERRGVLLPCRPARGGQELGAGPPRRHGVPHAHLQHDAHLGGARRGDRRRVPGQVGCCLTTVKTNRTYNLIRTEIKTSKDTSFELLMIAIY